MAAEVLRERDPAYALLRELSDKDVLIYQIRDFCADDPEFLADSLEGATDVFELIDRLVIAMNDDEIIIEGGKLQKKKIEDRVRRAEKRKETRRALIAATLDRLGVKKRRCSDGSTLSLSAAPIRAIVLNEAEIPGRFFKPQEPVLDQRGLTDYMRERAKRLAEIDAEKDEARRGALRQQLASEYPEIPGVTASNGGVTLVIR